MAKPTSPSVQTGPPSGAYQTAFQVQQHHDQNILVPHTYATQHTYTRHPPLSTWRSYNGKQLGHHHPPTQQNSSSSLPNHPQSAALVQLNSTLMNRAPPPPFSGRIDHQDPHPALHSTRTAPAPPPASSPIYNYPTTHWEQKHPSNQTNAIHDTQGPLSEFDPNHSVPQLPASQETLEPPTGIITEQIPFQSIEDGADKIEELVVEEMIKMRAHFDKVVGEMRNQLARNEEKMKSLEKRFWELSSELLHLKLSQKAWLS